MVTSVSSIQIKRPPEEVFEFITDPANARVWHLEIEEIDGPKGLPSGSTGRMVTRVMGQAVESKYEVIENDGKSITRVKSTQGPIRFETVQVLHSAGGEMTHLKIETRIDAGSIFRLAEPVLESLLRASIDADLQTLKVVLENQIPANGEPGVS